MTEALSGSTAPAAHRAGPGRVTPVSTYRLQLHEDFTFDDAAEQVAYLAELGVTHLYLSPILQSAPGSMHGYDVLDHTQIDDSRGGREGFDRLVAAARAHHLGLIVDVVPNHMTMPKPAHLNAPLWSLLREGRHSPYAAWFDVDWLAEDDRILMPILGGSLSESLAKGEVRLITDGGPSGQERVVAFYDDQFPVRPGTEDLPLPELLDAQAYRLAGWREAGEGLNYRRFFDVTSLLAVRVEDPVVFAATHALLLSLLGHAAIDGLRIDHPDGLADPQGYLEALADATGDAWVVVEKILEGEEPLQDSWRCAGTTGYDAMLRIQQVLTSDAGTQDLTQAWAQLATQADEDTYGDLGRTITAAKELVVADVQAAEVDRLMRLAQRIVPGEDLAALRRGLEALLVAMDRYRAYLRPDGEGEPSEYAVLAAAEERALARVADADRPAVRLAAQLARGAQLPQAGVDAREDAREFLIRFQQTCGPVMAKGIEDTAFYRWLRLAGANEVGGHPETLACEVEDFHAYAAERLAHWPTTMTGLTTHDTKRSEDVRARLMTLASDASGWRSWVKAAADAAAEAGLGPIDPVSEYLIWQTLIGTWPISSDRLDEYLVKAMREAKVHTAWVDGDDEFEKRVLTYAQAVLSSPDATRRVEDWLAGHNGAIRSNVLGQKLIQLTMPGVPDVYQGSEQQVLTLVDPDNRGAVDYAQRRDRLAALDAMAALPEAGFDLDEEKLLVTSRALRLRREHPEWFIGEGATYAPLRTSVPWVLAFARGDESGAQTVTVALLDGHTCADVEGVTVEIPRGLWRDALAVGQTQRFEGGEIALTSLLGSRPVALLKLQERQA